MKIANELNGTILEEPIIVPEGTYSAVLASIVQDESEKKLVRIGFTIKKGAYKGNEVFSLCAGIINEVPKFVKWINILKGDLLAFGEEVWVSTLVGNECTIIVSHEKKDKGTIFAIVKDIIPTQEKERS